MAEPRLLIGRYALGRLLGAGGMADVYEGTDTLLGRTVAVKMLRADLARDATFLARFRREAQSAASLSNPNIVAVHDTGVDDTGEVPVPFIVMEYVDGPSLRDMLRERGTLTADEAAGIVADVCAALQYSHSRGIVHRDIKPGNVMLTSSGVVKVMDFGIARAITSNTATMTQSSTVLGTAHYLSPEQARGDTVDARSDLYSTGVLLFELVTGETPFNGESPVAIAYQHVREQPQAPSERNRAVPPTIDAVVLKAMSKNPDNRYQSAAEMRADLLAVRSGATVVATPVMSEAERTALIGAAAAGAGATSVMGSAPASAPLPRKQKKSSAPVIIAVTVIALIAAGIALLFALRGGGDVEVPSLIGMERRTAESTITDAGLKVGRVSAVTVEDEAEVDKVIEQNPTAGRMVVEGTTVDFSYGTEADVVDVPDVTGKTLDEAREILAEAELRVGSIDNVASDKPEGEVVEQNPASGSQIPRNSSVNLSVASGETPVPNVIGQTEDAARQTLQDAGFRVTKTTRASSSDAGTVIDQQPSPGAASSPGSAVNIVVSTGPDVTPEPTPTETPTEPGTGIDVTPSPKASDPLVDGTGD